MSTSSKSLVILPPIDAFLNLVRKAASDCYNRMISIEEKSRGLQVIVKMCRNMPLIILANRVLTD